MCLCKKKEQFAGLASNPPFIPRYRGRVIFNQLIFSTGAQFGIDRRRAFATEAQKSR
jgi:hypothetical protein